MHLCLPNLGLQQRFARSFPKFLWRCFKHTFDMVFFRYFHTYIRIYIFPIDFPQISNRNSMRQAYVEGVHAASRALVINALLMTLTTYAIPKVRPVVGHWFCGGKALKKWIKMGQSHWNHRKFGTSFVLLFYFIFFASCNWDDPPSMEPYGTSCTV